MNPSTRSIRWLNRGLVAFQALLMVATLWIAATGLQRAPQLGVPAAARSTPTTQPTSQPSTRQLAWYAPTWTRDLRQPPIEPQPVPRAVAVIKPPPPPQLKIRLLGTVLEDRDRYGLFADGNGKLLIRRLQEQIDDFTILTIERGKAQIKGLGASVWLTMPDYESRLGKE